MISSLKNGLAGILSAALLFSAGCNVFDDPVPVGNASYVKFIGGAKDETINRGLQFSDGGFILVGNSNSFETTGTDAYIARTDDSGNLLWEKTFGGSGEDNFYDVKEVSGNLMVLGYAYDDINQQRDFLLMQIDDSGNLLDSLTFGATDENETGRFLLPGSDGSFTLVGVEGIDESGTDIYTVKISSSFTVEWEKAFGLLEKFDEIGNVLEAPNGNLIWCGTISDGAQTHSRVVSTSPYGQPVWAVTYGEDDALSESGLMICKGWGSYYVLLSNNEDNSGDVALRFIDSNGTLIGSTHTYGDLTQDYGNGLCLTSDGGYAIIGTTYSGLEDTDVMVIRIDGQGNELWTQVYGGSGVDEGNFVIEDRDNGLALFSTVTFENNKVFGLIKTDSEGKTF